MAVSNVAVLIPWMGGCPYRLEALERVTGRLAKIHPPWEIVLGELPLGSPWVKARAVDVALQKTSAATLVVHDGDVWTDGLDAAVASLGAECRWAIPHHKVYRLAGGVTGPTDDRRCLVQAPYVGFPGGGIVVIDRDAYETCPLDPRFVGFGQEDESWALALTTIYGPPWRGDAPLWHWWHPPQPRRSRSVGNPESFALWRRYRRARNNPAAMSALVEEVS